ncbi:peptidoglycan-associated lipoprotein Pal [Brevundimonas halotolerans]|uniref:Peptidoglycan-associated lipoprotein n=1 Tax=Brevundimonas halotolerans TaxID=69670 RepID=A0A7W9A342_9CAUL|nr:peptidoglycan-associated lipoprotein Pal [Brevundimonas halotolerans]MBB5660509.1 peptidoglycan-associated lipoprotein [Brevundimonas halotolerans]
MNGSTRHPSRPLATACVLALLLSAGSLSACSHRSVATSAADGGPVAMPSTGGYGDDRVAGGAGSAPGSAEDFRINVGDRVYFDLDSYQLRADAYPQLDAQAAWLRRYPEITVRIEGNADERGTREYNLALGARRAEAVRTYLIGRGIPASRIDTISFGKERPIAQGSNEAAFAQNRNAHTAIVNQR